MQKRKSKISKIDPDHLELDLLNAITGGVMSNSSMFIDAENSMGHMITALLNSSIELSKIVIENRVRNSDHMIDEDIYDIHKKSFQSIKGTLDDLKEE